MTIAIIKNGICKDVAVFGSVEIAESFLQRGMWDADSVVELPDGYGIGDSFDGEAWVKIELEADTETPITETESVSTQAQLNIMWSLLQDSIVESLTADEIITNEAAFPVWEVSQ